MTNKAENEILTRCGPGTPMGELMRQYWIPVASSEELPEPDCAPVRIRVLNENLIAFRSTDGRVGLIEDACPHRGASLFFGRIEENGIRCVYHGWKFDVSGQCVDQMNEPDDFSQRVRAVAYPTRERGGCIWAYMGPRKTLPPLPELEGNLELEGLTPVKLQLNEHNWLQAMENNMDTSHGQALHHGAITVEVASQPDYPNPSHKYVVANRAPVFRVRDTDFGVSYGALRPAEEDMQFVRTMHWLWPFYTMTPTTKLGTTAWVTATVPVDDYHNMQFSFIRRLAHDPRGDREEGGGRTLPNTTDWLGRFRNGFDPTTDFGIDRDLQRRKPPINAGFSGIRGGVPVQDEAMKWSQGRHNGGIVDRSREHLGSSDAAIIRVRMRLLDAARALQEHGTEPPCIDTPEVYLQRSGWVVLPKDVDYWEGARDQREAFRAQLQAEAASSRA